MLTRYILHISDLVYELQDGDLKNWSDIKCSYKRASYDGVVRSFSTQFDFTGNAYEMLLVAYLKDRYDAKASIEVQTSNDNWEYSTQFECAFDFSSITWDSHTLSLNCIDNSLASVIKSLKGTTYEFEIGKDIVSLDTLSFDRVPVKETLTYAFTNGDSFENIPDIVARFDRDVNPWVGLIGDEILVNRTLDYRDDQTDTADSYVFKAVKDISVEMDFILHWVRFPLFTDNVNISINVRRNGSLVPSAVEDVKWNRDPSFLAMTTNNIGQCISLDDCQYPGELISKKPQPADGDWGTVQGIVWTTRIGGNGRFEWYSTGKTVREHFSVEVSGKRILNLKKGDEVFIGSYFADVTLLYAKVQFIKSEFKFSWIGRGDTVDVPVHSPEDIGTALASRMAADNGYEINTEVVIGSHDPRISGTYLAAAESVRGIPGAKFYSSFNAFCDWMSAVFGYVYYIGETEESPYRFIRDVAFIDDREPDIVDARYGTNECEAERIIYCPALGRFLYNAPDGNVYKYWFTWENYNYPGDGYARRDTLYRFNGMNADMLFRFGEFTGEPLMPSQWMHDAGHMDRPVQKICFVHRSEIFNAGNGTKILSNTRGLKYTVDSSSVYSAVTAGYDKKDYEGINGRDEFNFNSTYSTGCPTSDKTLSLLSKYRADSYGWEFAAQKRGADTTDSTSDKDVFFLLACMQDGMLVPDRTVRIENALSEGVFNGAFSPMSCVAANAGIIGLQSARIKLAFASSTGNSEIIIDGKRMSDDMYIDTPIATCGIVEFTTDDISTPSDINGLIEVSQNDMRYLGYIQELELKYARTEAAKYKLIIKEVQL